MLLSTLHWLGLGSSNSSLLEGISANGIMYDVESSFSESVVSHLARILSVAAWRMRAFCVCVSGLRRSGAALSVTVRYKEAARCKHGGTAEARRRLKL